MHASRPRSSSATCATPFKRIETRRREEQRSARGGGVFEDAVADFVQSNLGGYGYIVETTGNVVGLRPNCKVGDVVIQFPADHAFAGHKVVIEAKRDKSYTLNRCLDEIATARKNRDAGAGIFVLARSHAGAGFPTFARYGHDIMVIWDDENPGTDAYLQAALMVAVGLATRSKTTADEGDLAALQNIEQRIVGELKRLDEIRRAAESIRKQAEKINAYGLLGDLEKAHSLAKGACATAPLLKSAGPRQGCQPKNAGRGETPSRNRARLLGKPGRLG